MKYNNDLVLDELLHEIISCSFSPEQIILLDIALKKEERLKKLEKINKIVNGERN
jgi:transcription initiation factor IIE alpha subunit